MEQIEPTQEQIEENYHQELLKIEQEYLSKYNELKQDFDALELELARPENRDAVRFLRAKDDRNKRILDLRLQKERRLEALAELRSNQLSSLS